MPRRGYTTQSGVSTPGTAALRPCALQGRQIEHRKNTRHPCNALSPFRANREMGWFPGLKPWAKFSSPFLGAAGRLGARVLKLIYRLTVPLCIPKLRKSAYQVLSFETWREGPSMFPRYRSQFR
jgi:hypothetical protein